MDEKDDNDIENKVLENVQALENLLDRAIESNEGEEDKPSVILMLEEVIEDVEYSNGNFNVSIFDFTRESEALTTGGVLSPSVSTCVAYGLLALLEKDTESVLQEGYKFLTQKIEEEITKNKKGDVVSFSDYKKSVTTDTITLPLTSKMNFNIKDNDKDKGE